MDNLKERMESEGFGRFEEIEGAEKPEYEEEYVEYEEKPDKYVNQGEEIPLDEFDEVESEDKPEENGTTSIIKE
jgi:hypothetical protein